MTEMIELYYSLRYCDECGGHQKNCEHYWNGWTKGQGFRNAEIIDWIERNRTIMDLDEQGDGVIIRDHFSSDDLIKAIKSGKFN
jgi:hypothetical protein